MMRTTGCWLALIIPVVAKEVCLLAFLNPLEGVLSSIAT